MVASNCNPDGRDDPECGSGCQADNLFAAADNGTGAQETNARNNAGNHARGIDKSSIFIYIRNIKRSQYDERGSDPNENVRAQPRAFVPDLDRKSVV